MDEGVEMLPELCDWCGVAIYDLAEVYALIADSSFLHPEDPRLDGWRLVAGCSDEHLAKAVAAVEARPFDVAELWAGKVSRAFAHGEGAVFRGGPPEQPRAAAADDEDDQPEASEG